MECALVHAELAPVIYVRHHHVRDVVGVIGRYLRASFLGACCTRVDLVSVATKGVVGGVERDLSGLHVKEKAVLFGAFGPVTPLDDFSSDCDKRC